MHIAYTITFSSMLIPRAVNFLPSFMLFFYSISYAFFIFYFLVVILFDIVFFFIESDLPSNTKIGLMSYVSNKFNILKR